MENDVRVSYRIKLVNGDTTVENTYSAKKRRILNRIRGHTWQNGYLRVSYRVGDNEIGKNEGHYTTEDDMIAALFAFSDQGLLDYLEEGA